MDILLTVGGQSLSLSLILTLFGKLFTEFGVDKKLIPVISMVLGIIIAMSFLHYPTNERVLIGIMCGFTSVGMYSGPKNVTEYVKEEDK